MKKYLLSLAVLLLLVSFTACSGQTARPSSSSSASQESALSSGTDSVDASQPDTSSADPSSSTAVSSNNSAVSSKAQSVSGSKSTPSKSTPASSQPAQPSTVRVVIPEGWTLSQIGDRLEANGVCKKADLLKTANSYNFSYYSLIGSLAGNPNRCYKLEGYLYPDTYEFYTNMKPQDALGKMLRGAQSHISGKYSYPGMTTDQLVTLASIIEKECGNPNEIAKVSSVFHNRLKAGMKLQADPTINYIEKYVKPNLTGDINRYNSYYNTYKCAALPAGPICGPGASALNAAAHPADTDYLYFCADKNGNYYYAKTLEEHDANLAKGGIVVGNSLE